MRVIVLFLLFFITPAYAGQLQYVTATGRITSEPNFDPTRPLTAPDGYTVVNCNGSVCGGAATIANPITFPTPPSAGWTSCATGDYSWSRISGNNILLRTTITATSGGAAVFRCRLVSNRRDVLEAVEEMVRENNPNFRPSRLATVIDIRQACPVSNVTQACITARELGDALEPAALTTLLNEANTLITAKGY